MPAAPRRSEHRPPRFPPPQFPAHKPKLFATTPPAIFGVILGLQGLVLAFRLIVQEFGWPISGLVEALKVVASIEEVAVIRFADQDVVRHPLIQKIVRAYEAYTDQAKN